MKPHQVIWLIVAAVLAWGTFHAVGTYLNVEHQAEAYRNIWRPIVVLTCVLGFLAFWGVMLAVRRNRLRR